MSTQSINAASDRIVVFPELSSIGVHFSRMHLRRLEKEGKFPKRIKISDKRIGWLASELQSWIKERAEGRKAA